MDLSSQQLKAIDHVERFAAQQRQSARIELEEILARASLYASILDEVMRSVRAHGRVAMHFHPDRIFAKEQTVAMGLLEAGVYRNQYHPPSQLVYQASAWSQSSATGPN